MHDHEHLNMDARDPVILLAEDDLTQRSLYTRILISAGYFVLGIDDGVEALRVARAERPALILMDVGLPGLDGWHVAHALKTDAATRDIPIIIMSGQFMPAETWTQFKSDCDVFLAKPIAVRFLLETIVRILPPRAKTA